MSKFRIRNAQIRHLNSKNIFIFRIVKLILHAIALGAQMRKLIMNF